MAKKFGKFLFLTAAVGTAAAAAYYYIQKKNSVADTPDDEDYDDFSEDLDENTEASRNYVALNPEAKTDEANTEETKTEEAKTGETAEEEPEKKDTFTPLSEQVKQTEETVEEFFDENDPAGDDTPAGSN